MYQAVVVLQSIDRNTCARLLQGLADALDLVSRDASPDSIESGLSQRWVRQGDEAPLLEMRLSIDTDMQCDYLALRGDTNDAVKAAVALAYAQLPVKMPHPLAQEAIAHWRSRPGLLQCAALVATDETAGPLAQAIFVALSEADEAAWESAASAAALMPATQSHWLISTALATQQNAERREKLERLLDLLNDSMPRAR